MNRVIKLLPLDLIKLDEENVRFGGDIAESQIEALQLLMEDPQDAKKLIQLAKHISQNGLDPTELQLVAPDSEGNYIALEGNRRLAALKLLITPELCPVEKNIKDFSGLAKNAKFKIPKELHFGVVSSRLEGSIWVELKHTGENGGAGRVAWDSNIRDERKSRASGIESIGRQLRKIISENIGIFGAGAEINSKKIPITNLSRLFQSSPAQNYYQLEVKSNSLTPKISLKYIAPSVIYSLEKMAQKGFTVNDIRNTEDRFEFIYSIPARLNPIHLMQSDSEPHDTTPSTTQAPHPPEDEPSPLYDEPTPTEESNDEQNGGDISSNNGPKNSDKDKKIRSAPDRSRRARLIDWPLDITENRIKELFRELRSKLDVNEVPNAVSVSFRVFLELSCDAYIKKHSDTDSPVCNRGNGSKLKLADRPKLSLKLTSIARHLKNSGLIANDAANLIAKRSSGEDSIGSVDHLNQFVHSLAPRAIPSELNAIADEYRPFLEALWR